MSVYSMYFKFLFVQVMICKGLCTKEIPILHLKPQKLLHIFNGKSRFFSVNYDELLFFVIDYKSSNYSLHIYVSNGHLQPYNQHTHQENTLVLYKWKHEFSGVY